MWLVMEEVLLEMEMVDVDAEWMGRSGKRKAKKI